MHNLANRPRSNMAQDNTKTLPKHFSPLFEGNC